MEKMNKQHIDYSNDSANLIRDVSRHLNQNNFHSNNRIENITLLEKTLISYSTIKLFRWNVSIDDIDMKKLESLESICQILDSFIPQDGKKDFFMQYINCIIYTICRMNERVSINLSEIETSKDLEVIVNDGAIKQIIINNSLPHYQVPSIMLEEIKKIYTTEKIPVLRK